MSFAAATGVVADGPGRWVGEQHVGWDINGNANGGVILAMGARAMALAADRPDPLTVTGHYLRPVLAGPVEITTSVVKAGRRLVTVTAQLSQNGQPALQLLGSFGDLTVGSGPTKVTGERPIFPPPDACIASADRTGFTPALHQKVDTRLLREDCQFAEGGGTGQAVMRGWFRLHDGEPLDPFAVLLAADALPPAVFNADIAIGWVPTVELTCQVRRRPVSEWLQCSVRSRYIFGGSLEEDVEIWDEQGLVALARQLAFLPLG